GISGLGVAQGAVRKGYKVCLLERHELATQTSASSLRIIHGGLRYLQSLDFERVRSSIRAQSAILEIYPSIVKPLKCLHPVDSFGLKSKSLCSVAAAAYNYLYKSETGHSNGARVRRLSKVVGAPPLKSKRVLLW